MDQGCSKVNVYTERDNEVNEQPRITDKQISEQNNKETKHTQMFTNPNGRLQRHVRIVDVI